MHHPKRMLSRVVAPASEPVTLAEAKLYLRVDGHNEDVLIGDLIVAARMQAEHFLRRSLITQTWKAGYDYHDMCGVALPLGPVQSIVSVTVFSAEDTPQILSADTYYLNEAKDTILFSVFTGGDKIEVVYVAGFGDTTAVPRPIKIGMLAHIAAMYDNRGDMGEGGLPAQIIGFYAPYREVAL
ncbi:MAG: hypothetical protein EBR02_01340 [Alphaproteobacteria bacterium]|nr:hypothetical protein [Alphaproteobacteria bacterium]